MQILNWMHKKLHPSTEYSRVSQKRDIFYIKDDSKLETDNELLLHEALDGILTIGTLGDINEQLFAAVEEKHVISVAPPVLTESALVVARRRTPQPAAAAEPRKPEHSPAAHEDDKKANTDAAEAEAAGRKSEIELVEPLLKEDREKREKRRPTLAELFTASDATEAPKENNKSSALPAGKKTVVRANSGGARRVPCRAEHGQKAACAKKGEEPPPRAANCNAKKINKLITRMLKKKIHPWEAAREGERNGTEAQPLVAPPPVEGGDQGRGGGDRA